MVYSALLIALNALWIRTISDPNDFGSFIASGRAASGGLNPYGSYDLTSRAVVHGETVFYPNLNPPISVLLFEAVADAEPEAAVRVWRIVCAVLYVWGVGTLAYLYRAPTLTVAWALCLAGFWNDLSLGQIYVPLFAAVAGVWMLLRGGRTTLAGVLIGVVVALKPNLAIWPVFLLLAGHRRTCVTALTVAALLSALPLARFGPGIYAQWAAAVRQSSWFDMPHYASLFSFTARLGVPWLGLALSGGLLVVLGWWAWRRRPGPLRLTEAALLAAYLVSPSSSPRLAMFLLPIFMRRRWDARLGAAAILLVVPAILVFHVGLVSAPAALLAGLPYTLALVAIGARLWDEERRHAMAPGTVEGPVRAPGRVRGGDASRG